MSYRVDGIPEHISCWGLVLDLMPCEKITSFDVILAHISYWGLVPGQAWSVVLRADCRASRHKIGLQQHFHEERGNDQEDESTPKIVLNAAKEVQSTNIDEICTTARHDYYKGIATLLFVIIH